MASFFGQLPLPESLSPNQWISPPKWGRVAEYTAAATERGGCLSLPLLTPGQVCSLNVCLTTCRSCVCSTVQTCAANVLQELQAKQARNLERLNANKAKMATILDLQKQKLEEKEMLADKKRHALEVSRAQERKSVKVKAQQVCGCDL